MNCRSLLRHVMTHGVGCKPVIYMLIGMADDVPGVSGHFAPVRSALMLCSASHEVATCCNKSEVLFCILCGLGLSLTATISNTGYGDEGTIFPNFDS